MIQTMYLVKIFYSTRYTKPSQLIARLQLTFKRKLFERLQSYLNKRFLRQTYQPGLNKNKIFPIFPVRSGYFTSGDSNYRSFSLTFLNHTHFFQIPINWHPKELEFGTRLWKLNLHYHEFLEEVENLWFEKIILDWIENNRPYKNGYWLDSWNSYSLSIRVVVWMQQISKREQHLSFDFIEKVSLSLYNQLRFLEENLEKDIRGNHIIKNVKALLWSGYFFKMEQRVNNWTKQGEQLLLKEIDEQILCDGMHFERSPAYHSQVFADLLECYIVLKNEEARNRLKLVLAKMASALKMLTHPDGKVSLFNDGGLDMSYSPKILLETYQTIFDCIPASFNSIELNEAGYYGLVNRDSYLLYDAGKIAPDYLPAHGHGDIFSFEWTIGGQRVFIDKGVFEYNIGEKRDLSRATKSHNTLSLNRKDQCQFWGAFRVAKRAKVNILEKHISSSFLFIKGYHDGYKRLKGKPVHEREISFDGKILKILDKVIHGDGQEAEAHFLLHPSINLFNMGDYLIINTTNTTIKFESNSPFKVVKSSWYPNFGEEEPCSKIIVCYGSSPTTGICTISKLDETINI